MHHVNEQLRRGALRAAAALPQVIDGDDIRPPEYHLKPRPNGVFAVFRGSTYVKTTKCRDRAMAGAFLRLYVLQQQARREGEIDARYAPVPEIVAYYLESIPAGKTQVRRCDTHRPNRLKPYLEGKRLVDLTGAAVAAIEKKMLATLRPATVRASFVALRTAIRAWCRDHSTEVIMPFPAMPPAPGRDRVISAEEQERIRRWARGDETYDVATGTWSPGRVGLVERHSRLMVGRMLDLGLATGTRPGRLMGLAWAPNAETGHIDVENGMLHRCPLGAQTSARKRAPSVLLPPGLLAEVRRWKAADGDEPYVIRTRVGKASKPNETELFANAMRKIGIRGVSRHTMRHTCITRA